MVDITSLLEKSLLNPKSIILTQVGSLGFKSMKFSGLMSLMHKLRSSFASWKKNLGLPVADVVAVEVNEGTEQLLHDHSSFFLS